MKTLVQAFIFDILLLIPIAGEGIFILEGTAFEMEIATLGEVADKAYTLWGIIQDPKKWFVMVMASLLKVPDDLGFVIGSEAWEELAGKGIERFSPGVGDAAAKIKKLRSSAVMGS